MKQPVIYWVMFVDQEAAPNPMRFDCADWAEFLDLLLQHTTRLGAIAWLTKG